MLCWTWSETISKLVFKPTNSPSSCSVERQAAFDAAQRLCDEVESRYEAATSAAHRSEADLGRLKAARARLDEKLLRYLREVS
jgi:hypothetical protein